MAGLQWFQLVLDEGGARLLLYNREPILREYVQHNLSTLLDSLEISTADQLIALPEANCIASLQEGDTIAMQHRFAHLTISPFTFSAHAGSFVPSNVTSPTE